MKQNMQNSHTKAVLLLHRVSKCIQTLQNTDEVINNGHSIATGSIGYTSRRQTKQKHNTICVGHHYPKTNTTHIRRHIYKQLDVKLNRTFKTVIVADITIRNSDTYNDIA
jgi:D-tyrosyl-tRNA(Tyr) deacylase